MRTKGKQTNLKRPLTTWAKGSTVKTLLGLLLVILAFGLPHTSRAQTIEPLDGAVDPTFKSPYPNFNDFYAPSVTYLAFQKDGKLLSVRARYTDTFYCDFPLDCVYHYYGNYEIKRLDGAGIIDNSFSTIFIGGGQSVEDLVVQNDDKIIVAGRSETFIGTPQLYIPGGLVRRYNKDGTLDTTFNNTTQQQQIDGTVRKIALQSDGKILVGGSFSKYNGKTCNGIVRLNPDGNIDPSFNCASSSLRQVISILPQSNGKILIGGDNTQNLDGTSPSNYGAMIMNRLHSDGSLDNPASPRFDVGRPYKNISTNLVAPQNDGKVLVLGSTQFDDGYSWLPYLVRLDSAGNLDKLLNPPQDFSKVDAITTQRDGKLLLMGYLAGESRSNIYRLNADGSLDTSFTFSNAMCCVDAMLLQKDNKILVGGTFNSSAGYYLARLYNSTKADNSTTLTNSPGFPVYGQSVILTATVDSSIGGLPAPGGFVIFNISGRGSVSATVFNGVATYVTNTLPVGSYTVTATYSGDVNYKSSVSDAFNLVVWRTLSVINLSSSANPALVGRGITFTTRPLPQFQNEISGTVSFNFNFADGTNFSTAPVALVNGVASYMTETLATGAYTLTARYSGDANRLSGESPAYTQYIISGCDPLVVTATSDDGQGSVCGTFSYALAQTIDGKISFDLPNGANTLSFSSTLTATLKPGVAIDGGVNGIILDGGGMSGDGLRLSGNNTLTNLIIRGFASRELLIDGKKNRFYRVKIES